LPFYIIYLSFTKAFCKSRLSCAEVEVYHNVRHHMFSEICICRKFYSLLTQEVLLAGREIYFLGLDWNVPLSFHLIVLFVETPRKFITAKLSIRVSPDLRQCYYYVVFAQTKLLYVLSPCKHTKNLCLFIVLQISLFSKFSFSLFPNLTVLQFLFIVLKIPLFLTPMLTL
jgi:hypothetical protein